jgi:hypothetical protein
VLATIAGRLGGYGAAWSFLCQFELGESDIVEIE